MRIRVIITAAAMVVVLWAVAMAQGIAARREKSASGLGGWLW
ncbi:MAG: hypothetical protein K0Q72_3078 [Armatimonadetes bacterium]|jgi:hypothetical protein|nr:hypothetical protein [Armatimonadota bacterium]